MSTQDDIEYVSRLIRRTEQEVKGLKSDDSSAHRSFLTSMLELEVRTLALLQKVADAETQADHDASGVEPPGVGRYRSG